MSNRPGIARAFEKIVLCTKKKKTADEETALLSRESPPSGGAIEKHDNDDGSGGSKSGQSAEVHKNQLGTINGAYVPCLLTIMGIILFERFGWGIGQVGLSGVFIMLLIGEIQVLCYLLFFLLFFFWC